MRQCDLLGLVITLILPLSYILVFSKIEKGQPVWANNHSPAFHFNPPLGLVGKMELALSILARPFKISWDGNFRPMGEVIFLNLHPS